MLVQSLFVNKVSGGATALVKAQPNPSIFLKVFLELHVKSLVSYLAFDNHSIDHILHDEHEEFFPKDFPIFYRNEEGKSAIDTALDANQIRSVNTMIEYICRRQDSWVYANLFTENLVSLINKGVTLRTLFDSNVFKLPIDSAEWPSAHKVTSFMLKPYDGSVFDLRFNYEKVFPKVSKSDTKVFGANVDSKRMFKIKYEALMVTSMSELTEDGRLMEALAKSEELELFNTELAQEIIMFKWNQFAGGIHYLGAILHFVYAIALLTYIKWTFIWLQPVEADGMIAANVMKNNRQDFKRWNDQYEIEEDLRFLDKRIYPRASPY